MAALGRRPGPGRAPVLIQPGQASRYTPIVVPVEIDIDHVARLARLALTPEERDRLRAQLGVILEHAARVQQVAAEDVPPTAYAIPRSNVFRADEPEPTLTHEDAVAGAPEVDGGRFKVPRIVEQD